MSTTFQIIVLKYVKKSHIIFLERKVYTMLVRFSVENFMSYKDRQVFSMIAGKQTKHKDHIFNANGKRVLKGSFFFGANAAGKSNLFKAIRFARDIALRGLRRNILTNMHFRIDEAYAGKPGIFQFDIFTNGHFYSYGFSISYQHAKIEEEWLYLCDSSDLAIFERSMENDQMVITTDFKFSNENQRQSFHVFSENVSDDKLFLSEIAERKLIEHPDFFAYRDVMKWLKDLMIILPNSKYRDKISLLTKGNHEDDLVKILQEFDTGIEGITLGEESMEETLDFLPEKVKAELIQDIETSFHEVDPNHGTPKEINVEIAGRFLRFLKKENTIYASQLMMDHGNKDDPFELADESDGTQRLFDLIPVYRAGKTPRVILVDELDRSFHTKLVIRFIQKFFYTTCGIGSQLIASVHDSNVMDLDILRQDEIWFVERQEDHSTKIFSLNKFQARFDKKVSKDYLLGRYGAIPCFSQIEDLDEEEI